MKKRFYAFIIVVTGLLALFVIGQLSTAQNKTELNAEKTDSDVPQGTFFDQSGLFPNIWSQANTHLSQSARSNSAALSSILITQYLQQGSKLVGTGDVGSFNPQQGWSVSVSGDGNTAIVGGISDNNNTGAVWVWTRNSGIWTQQGNKLVGSGTVGSPIYQGESIAISSDGNTVIVGGRGDNNFTGAAWVWVRSNGVWTQQGNKLVGLGGVGGSVQQGYAVALSADGNTAFVGSSSQGGWIWTRNGGVWTQQGPKLLGSGAGSNVGQGQSVALSADGNTAIMGGPGDNAGVGAVWVWTRNGGIWTQQGNKLVGSGAVGPFVYQGSSISISADGNTAVVGGILDNTETGAAWVWTRSGGVWTQQGNKLVGTGAVGATVQQGRSVSISSNGNTIVIGGPFDNNRFGAAWLWTRSNGIWTQQGNKLVGTGAFGTQIWQGFSVAISGDGNTVFSGGYGDTFGFGASWVFVNPNPSPSINSITSPIVSNQTTNLVINGANFQSGFTASVTTPSGTFPIPAAGLAFINSSQVRVQVNMSGTPPYQATLRITNPDNQSATGQFQVVSTNSPPPVIISISPSQVLVNQPTTLTVNGNNFQPNFRVSIQGLEIPQTGLNFINSHEIRVQTTLTGTPPYQASLLLTNPDNQIANGNFNVSSSYSSTNSPIANFSFSPSSPNVSQPIQFTTTSTGQSITHAWDFQGDGVFDSNNANPTFTYSTPGPRTVILRVTNPYGTSTTSKIVNVGTTNTSAPVVTNVFRTYPGLYFLKNANFSNNFDVQVIWNGSIGRVRFQTNNDPPVEVVGNTNGASRSFNLSTAFPASWSRSVVKITPINGQGVTGETVEAPIYVFPYPSWLDEAIIRLGPSALNFTAESGQIKANFNVDFPQPPFKTEIPIPASVPYFGGTLGIRETSAFFRGFASSAGTGNLTLGGQTGFKAMGQEIGGNVSGSGNFVLNQSGLSLQNGTFNLGINGTLSRNVGIIDAVPQLSVLNNIPAIMQFNQNVQLTGYVRPSVNFNANWLQDTQTRRFRFNNATGRIGLELGGELNVRITDHIKAKAWVSGGGGITFRVPQEPFVQNLDVNFQTGVQLNFNYLYGGFDFRKTKEWNCTWTPSDNQANCSSQASLAETIAKSLKESDNKVSLIENNYSKFGGYEIFHQNAEETNKIVRKKDSSIPLSIAESSLINNLFPGAEPVLLEVGTGRILLWVRQNPNLPVLQSTEIAWSYYDGASWSNPAIIVTDSRAELSPVAGVDANGKVIAAWLRVKDPAFSTNIENYNDLPLFYKQMEVVSSVFNPATRTWNPETILTDDLALDTNLRLSSDTSGKLLLTWQSNPSGQFNADAVNPATLKYSFWNGSNWNVANSVAGNLVNVNAQAAAVKGNSSFIILPHDPNLNISGDRILDIYVWNGTNWGQATTFAAGNMDNILPSAVYDSSGQGQVIWIRGSDLVQATLSNPVPQMIREGSGSMAFYNARLISNLQGNLTMVWQEMIDNSPANIFARLYDTSSQTWSTDLRLNENDWSSKDMNGYYGSDGKLRMAYLATQVLRRNENVTINGQTYEIPNTPEDGQTDLRLLEHSLIMDVAVTDADLQLSPQTPQAGENVTATINIRNSGDFSVGSFNVKIFAGNSPSSGVLLGTTRVNAPFAAGERRTVTIPFVHPQTTRNIIAVVDADNEISEFSEVNNIATVYFENTPPVAIATATVTSGNMPLTVSFDASTSYDSDGDPISFSWTFADGTSSTTVATASHVFEQIGLYPVTVSVADSRGAVSFATVNINVGCSLISISPTILPAGSTAVQYSQNLSATGGIAPYSFSVISGALPLGVTLTQNGLLSGSPLEAGTFNVTIGSTYANGCPGSQNYTLVINRTNKPIFDFDGDGKTDIGIFRPSLGQWWYLRSSDNANRAFQFGTTTDKIVPADYTGDGKTDIATFTPSTGFWNILRSEDSTFYGFPFGASGDIAAPADYDGDNKVDAAVFRTSNSTWFISKSSGGTIIQQFGASGDKPAVADYDGDGKADLAIYRVALGQWWFVRSSDGGNRAFQFGTSTDKPIQGDYTGDGKADLAFFRPTTGEWFILRSEDASFYGFPFGGSGDIPASGDYDGDGKFDPAVFRPSNTTWYLNRSTAGTQIVGFGANGDQPVPNAFVP